MRIASYNQMFGCDGQSLVEFGIVHGLHKLKAYEAVERRARLERTVETIRQAAAEVICITEVLGERQRIKLIELLRAEGYTQFHTGSGHGLGAGYGGNVELLLATKGKSQAVFTPNFEVPAKLGFGGGVCGISLPGENLHLVAAHLPLARGKTKSAFTHQLKEVSDELDRLSRDEPTSRLILMGDFNSTYPELLCHAPQLAPLKKLTKDEPTCSTTTGLRQFYQRDIDLILGEGVEARAAGQVEGASDHRLVWAELA